MFRWQTLTGIALGLVCGIVFLRLANGSGKTPPPSGAILSESDGHLRELVIHYEPSAKEIVAVPYRDFLGALEGDVTVHVVCPSRAAFDELVALAGRVHCRLRSIVVKHPMTTWSRDRWVALAPAAKGPTTLWSPRGEASEELWPARAGDQRVGADIAAALAPSVFARRSQLFFDGGDFLADSENVFVVPRVLQRNIQRTVQTQEEFVNVLSAEFKRRVVLLAEAPEHHAGMFMVSAGNKTMLVGDPGLGKALVPAGADSSAEPVGLPGGPDFTPHTQHLFDAVAAQCAAEGYRVIRVPTIPACDGRSYLTYVNVLLDQQGGRRIVYLPFYRGAESLNTAARKIWESTGYEVRPVDCTTIYRHFGCLHCLVNVLTRS
jgi:N-dimethylarginine dimethylaminohydrolase